MSPVLRAATPLVAAFLLAATAAISPASASLYLADAQTLQTTVDSPANHVVGAGGFFDGVGLLTVNRADGSFMCSSSLLGSGRHLLTAAHCVTNGSGIFNTNSATVSFFGDSGTYNIGVANYFIATDWTTSGADIFSGSDIAVLELAAFAPTEITRYDLFGGPGDVGAVATRVGYGMSGTGTTGTTIAAGTLRTGQNLYDADGSSVGISSNVLLYDFDDGTTTHDALGYFGLPDLGLGTAETTAAPGDSGGATFIGNLIAGVTSFGLRFAPSDYDGILNSSYGELGGDTRVSSYFNDIMGIMGISVPAPASFLLVLGLLPVVLRRRYRAV